MKIFRRAFGHLFSASKQNLGGHKFKGNHEVETAVTRSLTTQDTNLDQQTTRKLLPYYEKCLDCDGQCVGK
jgi:hypothetical protein